MSINVDQKWCGRRGGRVRGARWVGYFDVTMVVLAGGGAGETEAVLPAQLKTFCQLDRACAV